MRYPDQTCCAAAVILLMSLSPTAAENEKKISDLEVKIDRLRSEIYRLDHRVDQADQVVRRLLAYGIVDEEKFVKFIRTSISGEKPKSTIRKIDLRTTRPGIFEFIFDPKLSVRPVVLLTSSGNWGEKPVKNAVSQVINVSEEGFIVSISSDHGYVNGAFSFFVFAGDELNLTIKCLLVVHTVKDST